MHSVHALTFYECSLLSHIIDITENVGIANHDSDNAENIQENLETIT